MRIFFIYFTILIFSLDSALADELAGFTHAIDKQNWNKALTEAKLLKSPALQTLTTWLKLTKESNIDFKEITTFIKQHPHWPEQELLKRRVEESNFNNAKNAEILTWFKANPPQTIIGKKKYVSLLSNSPLKNQYIKQIWLEANFSKDEEMSFAKTYGMTSSDYLKRIEYMLFNNNLEQSNRLLSMIPAKSRSIYQTSIGLQQGKNVALIQYQKLDQTSKNNLVLLYSLARFYEGKKDDNNLIHILKISSKISGPNQGFFWTMKAMLIRDLIKREDYKTAYLFASSHGTTHVKKSCEAEWLAGWIALRFLDNSKLAITHFTKMYNIVKLPISLARGSYWLGRSYEKLNDLVNSKTWYETAAKYYTGFYGQLARCKLNNCQVKIPADPKIAQHDIELFNNNAIVKAALALYKTKYNYLVQNFLFQAVDNSKHTGEVALITRMGFKMNHYHLSVEAAKHASYKDMLIIHSNYPILKSVYKDHEVSPSLVMSLIRQESVFNHRAISSAGAMGLMQLMPHVAKETASKIKVSYNKNKLLDDPHFNTCLGINHLDKLLKKYDNSYILTIAAYNAGDKAVRQWIDDNGDPRLMRNIDQIIDWMEKISFYETRNYVQRVLEGKSIYYLLMNNKTKLPILDDLTAK